MAKKSDHQETRDDRVEVIHETFEAVIDRAYGGLGEHCDPGVAVEAAVASVMEGAPIHQDTVVEAAGEAVTEELTPEEHAGLDALERIIPADNNLLPVAFLAEGVQRQMAVARIALKQAHRGLPAGAGWGTGWLVSKDLHMTNNHVIPNRGFAKRVRAEFNYQNDAAGNAETPDRFDLDPDDFFVTNAALDYTVVRVKCRSIFLPQLPFTLRPTPNGEFELQLASEARENDLVGFTPDPNGTPSGVRPTFPPFDPDSLNGFGDFGRPPIVFPPLCIAPGTRWGHLKLPSQRVPTRKGMHLNVVQHPRGRRKELALQQNRLDEVFSDFVHYTTDTEPGSSGSPVFNNAWDVIALHHAGGKQDANGVWLTNEGVRVDRIVSDLRGRTTAAQRAELGI